MPQTLRSRPIALAFALAAAASAACARRASAPPRFTAAVPYPLDTLDPHARDWLGNLAVSSTLYETLVAPDADMRIQPRLALRWENTDPRTWRFHLRTGVQFHSGRLFSCRDAAFSIDRLRSNRQLELSGYAADVAEVACESPRTLLVRTREPVAILLNKMQYVFIVPDGSGPSLSTREDGTGPYRLSHWRHGDRLELRRFEAYWGPRPDAEEATFELDPPEENLASQIERGRLDFVQLASRREAEKLERRPGWKVRKRSSIYVKYLGFDLSRRRTPGCDVVPNPFLNPAVREAVEAVIDREALAASVPTEAVAAREMAPPFIFGFLPDFPAEPRGPPRARQLLREAGLARGFAVDLHVRKKFSETAVRIAAMLAPAGIRVRPVIVPDADFFDRLKRGDASFFLAGYGCPTGDVSEIFDQTIHTRDRARGYGENNFEGFSDGALDLRIEETTGALDVASRREMLHQIHREILTRRIWIPLYVDVDVFAMRERLIWRPRYDSSVLPAEIRLRDAR